MKIFFSLFLVFNFTLGFLPVNAQHKPYVPSSDERYTQRTRTQASRSGNLDLGADIDFEIIAPSEFIGGTSLENPAFFLEIHSISQPIILEVIVESNGDALWSTELAVSERGTIPIEIDRSLPIGRYILIVAYHCPEECGGLRMAFDRRALPSDLKARLDNLDFREKAALLAERGFIFDAIYFDFQNRRNFIDYSYDPLR
jgi:hypothetical protein